MTRSTFKRHPDQPYLGVRRYIVFGDGFGDYETEAETPAQAKWRAFQAAQEAGWFRAGFRAFLQHGFNVREVRR
jgi:hypothetical protein